MDDEIKNLPGKEDDKSCFGLGGEDDHSDESLGDEDSNSKGRPVEEVDVLVRGHEDSASEEYDSMEVGAKSSYEESIVDVTGMATPVAVDESPLCKICRTTATSTEK
jgi:hypothetical protein